MRNYLILFIILNLIFFIMTIFTPMNVFVKGIILGGMVVILIFQYILLMTNKR